MRGFPYVVMDTTHPGDDMLDVPYVARCLIVIGPLSCRPWFVCLFFKYSTR